MPIRWKQGEKKRRVNLFSYSGGIHKHHDQQHDVTSETSRFSVMDPKCSIRSDLRFLNHIHVDIVRCHMQPDQKGGGGRHKNPDQFRPTHKKKRKKCF